MRSHWLTPKAQTSDVVISAMTELRQSHKNNQISLHTDNAAAMKSKRVMAGVQRLYVEAEDIPS